MDAVLKKIHYNSEVFSKIVEDFKFFFESERKELWFFPYTMVVVLKKIHYNPEVFSKIVEDFKYFVERTKPGFF